MNPFTNVGRSIMAKRPAAPVWTTLLAILGCSLLGCSDDSATDDKDPTQTSQAAPFSSAQACRTCHQSIYDRYIATGHFLTSRPAVKAAIPGDFGPGGNIVQTELDGLSFKMERRTNGLFQTAIYAKGKTAVYRKPFEVIIGSGERGQTYLYWEQDRLYQLPVTYIAPKKNWILSPGYDERVPSWAHLPNRSLSMFYQRPVGARCLECHASAVTPSQTPIAYTFHPESLEFGISCEKCHGPGADHIAFHQEHPEEKEGLHIVNPARLSRSQQLSSCALCHAGQGVPVTPPLSFRPGDEIAEHRHYSKEEQKILSVHGGQVPFLEESRCFVESGTMTCSTCHNVHEDQTDRTELFSQKCLSCHPQSHPDDDPVLVNGNRCTECHMPDQQATNLTMFHKGDQFFLSMSNHRIGIFKDQ